ncbi:hypothetical protein [Oceanobacillus kapialis]|uniref:Uncharacterized protein n=1 Tax=Oceanobacillus kapialis TaxID=481353 RepID=A0ABW5Q578_9BACI
MQRIDLEKWLLEVDAARTNEYYGEATDLCECLDCKNYREACEQLDPQVKQLFHKLGIDPTKPDLLSEFGSIEDGLHLYMGHYYLVGKLIAGAYCSDVEWDPEHTATVGNFTFGFVAVEPSENENLSQPGLWLEFEAKYPWLVKEDQ